MPQGSVLGPLLFILYTNDLPQSLKKCKSILFADDTTVYITGKSKSEMFHSMKLELLNLIDWFQANKLSLNLSKTNYIFFKPSTKIKINDPSLNDDLTLAFGSETIVKKDYVKFLGITIDQHLNWTQQCQEVSKEVSSNLYMLNSVKRFIPFDCRKKLYYSFIYSSLSYGLMLWGPSCLKTELKPLKIQQNKALRAINLLGYTDSVSALYSEQKILTLEKMIELEISKFMYLIQKKRIT